MTARPLHLTLSLALMLLVMTNQGVGAGKYDPGATDTEIKIGNTCPYSGPASSIGTPRCRAISAYFQMLNDKGGLNRRKLTLLSYDDGYSPPKTLEMARRLVEEDKVLLLFAPQGTAPNTAIWKYLNQREIPQLFVASGATKWGDPAGHPWTMGFEPTYYSEGRVYAQYVLETLPTARIGILYQNDDYGKDYVNGFRDGLGAKTHTMIVSEQTYQVTDATVDSQIVNLKNSGATVFVDISIPKFAAQAIRRSADLGWRPVHFLNSPAASVSATLTPAGLDASIGVVSATFLKDPDDPQWSDDAGVKEWQGWMRRYNPGSDPHDRNSVYSYTAVQALVHVLQQAGNDLTRSNIMRQAAHISRLELPLLLPGITVNTSPSNFYPIAQLQLVRFDGSRWARFGTIMSAPAAGPAGNASR